MPSRVPHINDVIFSWHHAKSRVIPIFSNNGFFLGRGGMWFLFFITRMDSHCVVLAGGFLIITIMDSF